MPRSFAECERISPGMSANEFLLALLLFVVLLIMYKNLYLRVSEQRQLVSSDCQPSESFSIIIMRLTGPQCLIKFLQHQDILTLEVMTYMSEKIPPASGHFDIHPSVLI